MNILVIGNGFDLAHGLPTKYTDFLDFIKFVLNYDDPKPNERYNLNENINAILCRDLQKSNTSICELKELINENFWIYYFINTKTVINENWIDFEKEIAVIIHSLDDAMNNVGKTLDDNLPRISSSDHLKNPLLEKYFHKIKEKKPEYDIYEPITYKEIRDILYNDLNRLIKAFEIYLTRYVSEIECNYISPDIFDIFNTKIETNILSFNYTNTCEKLYLYKNNNIDYIHGKANINNTILTNNMVLGIDEYLTNEAKNIQVDFIAFKKYYQRIYKGTGNTYKNWIEDIRINYNIDKQTINDIDRIISNYNQETINNNVEQIAVQSKKIYKLRTEREKLKNKPKHNLYIYGHSLDITDKDILCDLILNDNVITTIFYYSKDGEEKSDLASKISNLVRIIGQDELIKRTGGKNQTIKFVLQRKMVRNSDLEDNYNEDELLSALK